MTNHEESLTHSPQRIHCCIYGPPPWHTAYGLQLGLWGHWQKCKSTIDCATRSSYQASHGPLRNAQSIAIHSRFIGICAWGYGTIYGWQSVNKPQLVFTADRLRWYCTHSLRAFLSGRLRACLRACLRESRASGVVAFAWEALGRWKTLSLWKLWLWRSQPTCLSASGTVTVTFTATITITITIIIITVSPGPNAHTYAQNRRDHSYSGLLRSSKNARDYSPIVPYGIW